MLGVIPRLRAGLSGLAVAAIPDSVPYATVPDSVITPAVVVSTGSPFAPSYSRRMGGLIVALYRFELTVLTGRIEIQSAQELLDELASGDGPLLPALFDSDAIEDATVVDVTGQSYGAVRVGNTDYAGFSLVVDVEA